MPVMLLVWRKERYLKESKMKSVVISMVAILAVAATGCSAGASEAAAVETEESALLRSPGTFSSAGGEDDDEIEITIGCAAIGQKCCTEAAGTWKPGKAGAPTCSLVNEDRKDAFEACMDKFGCPYL